jgi:hypothetical protein
VRHPFRLPEPGSPEIDVVSGPLRIPTVYVDGREVERRVDRGRSFWPIPVPGGGEKRLYIRSSLTGLRAAVDGTVIPLERQLSYWEVIVSLLPFGLVGLGIAGGVVGIVASALNLRLMRRPWPLVGRLLATLGVLAAAALVTLAILGVTRGS